MSTFNFLRRKSTVALGATICALLMGQPQAIAQDLSLEDLGRLFYFDTNFSAGRTQSCATCHNPDFGFADPRPNAANGAVSLGDDGTSLGDRNAPTASYARFTPGFHLTKEGIYKGGQFHDGRADTLEDQAGGPPLNPIEMGIADKAMLVERLKENKTYATSMKSLFDSDIFADQDRAYSAFAKAIAAFEKTDFFAPFDSKYDRYLKGEYQLTLEENLGMTLFFSNQFTNCNQCHQLQKFAEAKDETFTNYEYHNIGVPVNTQARAVNGVSAEHVDEGLFLNPQVNDPAQKGKIRTMTLRNVAVTGPYMHNGVFQDLKTVVQFYNKYNAKSEQSQTNPETGKPWGPPEVAENISLKELEIGDALTEKRINALVAFMKTLTDKRYEHLLEE